MRDPYLKKCPWCGKMFEPTPVWVLREGNKIFCKWTCLDNYRKSKEDGRRKPKNERKLYHYNGYDYTCRELATEIGVSYQAIKRRERDGRDPVTGKPLDDTYTNKLYEYNGQYLTSGEFAGVLGVDRHTIPYREKHGLDLITGEPLCEN